MSDNNDFFKDFYEFMEKMMSKEDLHKEIKRLRDENENLKHVRGQLEEFYTLIDDNLWVEDWANPEKGITEFQSYFDCLEEHFQNIKEDELREEEQKDDILDTLKDCQRQLIAVHHSRDNLANFLGKLLYVIRNDSTAITYQNIGQYRTMLIQMFQQEWGTVAKKDPPKTKERCPECNGEGLV